MSQVVNLPRMIPLTRCRDDNEAVRIFKVLTRLARRGFLAKLILDNDQFLVTSGCHCCPTEPRFFFYTLESSPAYLDGTR
jgi:hypothetical protein